MQNKTDKCSIRTTTGYLISTFSAALDGLSEGSSAGLSIFTSLGNSRLPLHIKATAATAIGGITGVIHSISSFCFQGSVIRENFSRNLKNNDDDFEYLEFPETISRKKKYSYFALKYGYSSFALIVVFFELYLLYSATKAWVSDLSDNEETPLSSLSNLENALLLTYYLVFDIPFVLTNEIVESCKEITTLFKFHPDSLPDQKFLNILKKIAMPLAENKFVRKFIRISGSLTDTLEHVLPLIIIIPPNWVLNFLNQPPIYSIGIGIVAGLAFLTISGTIFAQTYLFEGKYSEDNLKNIAWENILAIDSNEPWVNEKLAKFFHALLYLGGPLHGVDSGLSITLTLRELQVHPIFNYIAGGLAFFIGWVANHFSEVTKSQEALKSMTKISLAKLMSGVSGSRLFTTKQLNYSTNKYQEDDEEIANEPLLHRWQNMAI